MATPTVLSPTFPPIRSIITDPRQLRQTTADGGNKDDDALTSPTISNTTAPPAPPATADERNKNLTNMSSSPPPRAPVPQEGERQQETGSENKASSGNHHRPPMPVRSLSSIRHNKMTLLKFLHLSEDNARFLLLAIILLIYALSGAIMFMLIEADTEISELERRFEKIRRFRLKYPRVTRADLNDLLEVKLFLQNMNNNQYSRQQYTSSSSSSSEEVYALNVSGSAIVQNAIQLNRHWTFSGALYFVYTLMTTTGFGMTTPRTKLGRSITLLFGFFGCTCTILFFNLFLERVITLLTLVMTRLHRWAERRWLKRSSSAGSNHIHLPNLGLLGLIVSNPEQVPEQKFNVDGGTRKVAWKPSLYAVFCLLFFMSTFAVFICATIFAIMEETWTFLDSIYASFIAVATIGFGDFVPAFSTAQSSNALTQTGALTPSRRAANNATSPRSSAATAAAAMSTMSTTPATPEWYRMVAIMCLAFGTCCYYSLFNVSSILVKRFLTLVICKLDVDVTPVYDKCCRRHKSRFSRARIGRMSLNDSEMGGAGSGGDLDESEMRRRKSVIAHLRAAAVDRAMAKYDTSRAAGMGFHSERLESMTSQQGGGAERRPTFGSSNIGISGYGVKIGANKQANINTNVLSETSFSPSTSTGMLHNVENRMAKSASSSSNTGLLSSAMRPRTTSTTSSANTLRGRPVPQSMHPTVVDSDEDEWVAEVGEGDTNDDEDNDGMLPGAGRRKHHHHRSNDVIVRSEALKKVGMMKNNAIVLALMQKQLHAQQTRLQEAADEQAGRNNAAFGQPVGPLAIAKNMLE